MKHALQILVIATYLLGGLGCGEGVVLCLETGGGGSVAVGEGHHALHDETKHERAFAAARSPGDPARAALPVRTQTDRAPTTLRSAHSPRRGCERCLDIPLPAGAFSPHTVPARTATELEKNDRFDSPRDLPALSAVPRLAAPPASIVAPEGSGPPLSVPTPAFLRSVILLI